MTMDPMGDRMKAYEAAATSAQLDATRPVVARIDGRAFSRFTRSYKKPFDARISTAMRETTYHLVQETHALIGFVQSDEITLVWQVEPGQSMLFDGRVQKLTSVLASMASVRFYSILGGAKLPAFDCRVWQVPSQEEAANALLWRAFDARRNSLQSICRSIWSQREMDGLGQAEMRDRLKSAGVDIETEFSEADRHGVFYKRVRSLRELDDETWARISEGSRRSSRMVERTPVVALDLPFFGDVADRVAVVFDPAIGSAREDTRQAA